MKAHHPLQTYDVTIKYGALAVFVTQCAVTEFARDVGEQVVVAGTTHLTGPAGTVVLLCIRYPRPHSTVQCLDKPPCIRTIANGPGLHCMYTVLAHTFPAVSVLAGFGLAFHLTKMFGGLLQEMRHVYAPRENTAQAEYGLVQPRWSSLYPYMLTC